MIFGVPKEVREMETRVGLTPAGVYSLAQVGQQVFVEHNAGKGAGYSDQDYRRAGGQIVYSPAEVWGRADIVCKVARPIAAEHALFRPGQTLFAFLSMAVASSDFYEALVANEITAIAYEMIEHEDGVRPVLLPASEIAGRLAPIIAGNLLMSENGRGILLSGLPGIPSAAVVIIGAGTLGMNAARAFCGLGAHVVVLDQSIRQLRRLEQELGSSVTTMVANKYNVERAIGFADVVVGAVAIPGQRAPILITRDHVRAMRPGTILIDYSIDEGGCAETSRPTTRRSPTFVVDDVIHYCVPNITAAVGRTTSQAITNAALRYLLAAADGDLMSAERSQRTQFALRNGINLFQGKLVNPALALALAREAELSINGNGAF